VRAGAAAVAPLGFDAAAEGKTACDTSRVATHRLLGSTVSLRPSDAERERALGALKIHYAEGRLSTEELETYVEEVYRSGTHGEIAPYLRPLVALRRRVLGRAQRLQRAVLRMHVLTYATANASLVAIWALTGEGVFWPAWLLVPSTALLGWHFVASRRLTRALSRRRW
jgi:hypothetical protein